MTDDDVVVAIDAGQTGMRVRVERPDAPVTETPFPGIRTHEPLVPQLAALARSVADREGTPIDVLTAGISGLVDADGDAAELRTLLGVDGPSRVVLAHDSVTSYLGALGDRTGAVIAAGTGVVTLGVGRSAVARVDGWGHIMGDAGSGYWMGREALDAVMRAFDGRGPATQLTPVVEQRWPDLPGAYIALQSSDDRVVQVAAFARAVADLAPDDAVAAAICERAAGELAVSVSTALRRVAAPGDPAPAVATLGGVFGSSAVADAFAARLHELVPDAEIVAARGVGIDGAAELARLAPGHPLLQLVSAA